MSKSILVFIANRPFGVFSNKTNAWMAITKNADVDNLIVSNERSTKYLPASYNVLANSLRKTGKCLFLDRDRVENPTTEKVIPSVHVFQYETNIAVDGRLYKSGEVDENQAAPTEEPEDQNDDSFQTVPVQSGVGSSVS